MFFFLRNPNVLGQNKLPRFLNDRLYVRVPPAVKNYRVALAVQDWE